MSVEVKIKESLSITNIMISHPDITKRAPGTSYVQFSWAPQENDYERLRKEELRLVYSVEERRNEIQVMCGHFIHWFTPDDITRDKFIVFVLDVSGSMKERRIDQLKSAMDQFLTTMMSYTDYFSIITYSSTVNIWRETFDENTRSGIFTGYRKHRENARSYINYLQPGGLTNIKFQFKYIGNVKEGSLSKVYQGQMFRGESTSLWARRGRRRGSWLSLSRLTAETGQWLQRQL